ncbi:GLPGLI family protein [Flavobacterium branchiarum]|uniref:GLPGLI family protein n=1 Tax=Flavobacterium branchiarum TaxID=1114870 RepID=A0ABV5FL89_9FLAO|nr:GLPGLI family protein [Flavobacterium branchiarum]MDN3674890.1 GLPGLI family protein [Flavobacterium branchiarum]
MKYIYIVFIFFSFALTAQNLAKVNYIVLPTDGSIENREALKKLSVSFNGVDDAIKKLEYELLVSNNNSYFHLIANLDFNERAARLARSFAGRKEYYRDNDKKELIEVIEFSGEFFNVWGDINKEWELVNETKLINGYKCYKAITERKIWLKKTDNVAKVIAWYCPTIPMNFGPKGFGGLPGLILELQDDKMIYLASRIEISKKLKIKINKIEGKIISQDDFYKIVEKTNDNNINNLRK